MTLAESVRSHWVLSLAAVAFTGTFAVIAMQPCPHAAKKSIAQHRHVKAPRACREWQRAAPPRHEVTGADYRDILLATKPALESCLVKAKHDVTYALTANIRMDGTVESVDVKAESADLRKVDLKAVKCIENAMTGTTFPPTNAPKRVSTTLRRS